MATFHPLRRFASRGLPLLLLLAACQAREGPIRIGLAGPFQDPTGAPMKLAAELAVEEINAAGGVRGRRLELIVSEDHADPDSAVFVASDLYASDAVAVVGHLYSGTTLAAAPVYNSGERPLVAISPSSSSPEVTTAGDYTFRVCPSDLAHGATLAHWARERLQFRRGAVLYLNDQYGRGIRETFVREFVRLGGELTSVDPYLGDAPDVSAYLDRIAKARPPEFLLIAGNRLEGEEILRQARRRGLSMPVLGGDGLEGIEQAGALAEGVYLSSAYFPLIPSAANQRFVTAYRRRHPESGLPNQPAAAAYDAIRLLAEVISRVGPDREAVRRALAGVGTASPVFEGVTGTIGFDLRGDVADQNVHIGLVRNGSVQVQEAR